MATQKKIFTVQNLAEKFKQAKTLILADYSGLKVNQINELRNEIKKAGGEFEVVKNTLLRLAAKNGKWKMENGKLVGPTAALWIYKEDLSPLKALYDFINRTTLPKISGACSFRIKSGFWQGEQIALERIKELAQLPGIEEVQAKLVATLKSPTLGLVTKLNGNIFKLIFILKNLKPEGGEKQIKN